jgi:hypothetical protein
VEGFAGDYKNSQVFLPWHITALWFVITIATAAVDG